MVICYQFEIFNINTGEVYKTVFAKKLSDIIDVYFLGRYVAYKSIAGFRIKK